jgi:predicted lactoylglutathione lyase
MAATKTKRSISRTAGTPSKPSASSERFKQISKNSSQIVKDAAVLLDDEIAAGIVAAKQMQRRFQKERRVDPGDFKEAVQQFQVHAHEVVDQLNSRVSDMGSKENQELLRRLVNNSHDLLDLTVEVFNMGAELADQLVQSKVPRKQNAPKQAKANR